MTAKHYASADSVANAKLAKVSHTLTPQAPPAAQNRIASFLANLTPEELAALRSQRVV